MLSIAVRFLRQKQIFRFTLRHIRALSGLTTTKNRSAAIRAAIQVPIQVLIQVLSAIQVLEKRNRLCSGTRQTLYR